MHVRGPCGGRCRRTHPGRGRTLARLLRGAAPPRAHRRRGAGRAAAGGRLRHPDPGGDGHGQDDRASRAAHGAGALQKKQGVRSNRAVLSTFTNHLARQIREDDAPKVNAALEKLGYPSSPSLSAVGRRQFIDPDRVDRAVRESRDRRDGPDLRSLEQMAGFENVRRGGRPPDVHPRGLHHGRLVPDATQRQVGVRRVHGPEAGGRASGSGAHQPRDGPDGLPLPRRGAGHRGRRLDRRFRRGGHAAGGREEPGG